MASQNPPTYLEEVARPIYDDQELCQYLLRSLDAPASLEILPSKIHLNGAGLFAKEAIAEGAEVFRSTPLVSCVDNGMYSVICDYCFTSSAGKINPLFRAKGDIMPKINLCAECQVCGYCSKDCQKKAWKKYHKSECSALKEIPTAFVSTRALYRVLAMQKQGTLAEQGWRAVNDLQPHRLQHYSKSGVEIILGVSMNSKTLIRSEHSLGAIQDLYCRILTNCISIQRPLVQNAGTALDLVGAFMNHSCDPNAFVFFENSQLRVRSLKPIQPGDEITQTYVDDKAGMMIRGEMLRSQYFFTCECRRCVEELLELQTLSSTEGFSIQTFADTEKLLVDYLNKVANSSNASELDSTPEQVITKLSQLTAPIFPTRDWPDAAWPMPAMHLILAKLWNSSNLYSQAAIHATKGCLANTRRLGPHWVANLRDFILLLNPVVVAANASGGWSEPGAPGPRQLLDFFNGLMHELLLQAKKTYGVDVAYYSALARWYAIQMDAQSGPVPGQKGFTKRFRVAQAKVLGWARVDGSMGVVLSEGMVESQTGSRAG